MSFSRRCDTDSADADIFSSELMRLVSRFDCSFFLFMSDASSRRRESLPFRLSEQKAVKRQSAATLIRQIYIFLISISVQRQRRRRISMRIE